LVGQNREYTCVPAASVITRLMLPAVTVVAWLDVAATPVFCQGGRWPEPEYLLTFEGLVLEVVGLLGDLGWIRGRSANRRSRPVERR